ncbi:hypothetical protein GOODEAATRI_015371 [Goodea atripinnis]|uniref:Uncharacterized protein n=1 Tax=Goodea atripinnis TaxID=208336 RepID=A0ABV0MJY2_9TELE
MGPPNFPTAPPPHPVVNVSFNLENKEDSKEDPHGQTGDDTLHPEYRGDAGHAMNPDIVLNNVSKGSIHTWADRVAGPGQRSN